MRIVRAELLEYVRALDGRSWNPVSRWTERRAPFLVLESDEGIRVHAEAWSRQEQIDRVFEALAAGVKCVLGRSLDTGEEIVTLHNALPCADWPESAAASAIDMALWALLARTQRRPLHAMLGATTNAVRVYASGGLYRDGDADMAETLANEVSRYRAQGFRDVKIKVGGLPLPEDIRRIGAARAAMVDEGVLWVDAVNQLNAANAVRYGEAYRDAGASAIQAPVDFDDYPTMALIGRLALPVIAGEATFFPEHFERLLDDARVACLQLNLGLCGGFSGADRIAALAAARNVPVTVQAHGTAILLLASLQWGAARNVHNVEFHGFHDHLRESVMADVTVSSGMAALNERAQPEPVRPGRIHGEAATVSMVPQLSL